MARLKLGGGHGGNNGLRDIIQKLGSREFARLRIGIGHPGVGRDVSGYVLKQANKADQQKIDQSIEDAMCVIDQIGSRVYADLSHVARSVNSTDSFLHKMKNYFLYESTTLTVRRNLRNNIINICDFMR